MTSLDDLTVLDAGNLTAGPLTSWLLGSLGADVVKVEPPDGEHGRTILADAEADDGVGGYYFHSTNSDKRSAALDLKTDDGRGAFLDLVEHADVLVENFGPGTMASLGLDYDTLRERNDALVHCSITGYGHDNADAGRRAYDSILQARSGFMTATGYAEDPPTKVGASLVDNFGSYVASAAVLAALCHRKRTGEGQFVDVSMQDCAAWLAQLVLPFDGGRTSHQPADGPFPFNGVFETQDGWVSVSAPGSSAVDALSETVGDPDDFDDFEDRVAAWVAERSTGAVVDALRPVGVAVAPVARLDDVLADPWLDDRDAFETVGCHSGTLSIPVSPYCTALSGVDRPQTGGPAVGEHTDEVLDELAER